jgi:hypothetical protein
MKDRNVCRNIGDVREAPDEENKYGTLRTELFEKAPHLPACHHVEAFKCLIEYQKRWAREGDAQKLDAPPLSRREQPTTAL